MTASSFQNTDTSQKSKKGIVAKQILISKNLTREFLTCTIYRILRVHSFRLPAKFDIAKIGDHLDCGNKKGGWLL